MSGSSPSSLRVLAWPRARSQNPYTALLYDAILDAASAEGRAVEIVEFRPHRAWRQRADVIHVHWPEFCVDAASVVKALLKTVVVLFGLRVGAARGAAIVWTRHNTSAHDSRHPRLERFLRRRFEAMVDGVIDLTDNGLPMPESATAHAVIRHGDYGATIEPRDRLEAREGLGVAPHQTLLASLGTIRPYKEIPALVRAFATAAPDIPDARLLVAGRPASEGLAESLTSAAAGAPVELQLDWLESDAMERALAAADVVVLPYRRLENSGVALLALTAGRPVAATDGPAVRDLLAVVGALWVRPLQFPPTPATLVELVEWAHRARPSAPDLAAFAWPEIGRATLAFYDATRAG